MVARAERLCRVPSSRLRAYPAGENPFGRRETSEGPAGEKVAVGRRPFAYFSRRLLGGEIPTLVDIYFRGYECLLSWT